MGKFGGLSSFRQLSGRIMERMGVPAGRSLHITGASCIGNLCVGIGKLIMGLVSLSVFTCASAFYTFGMVAAKSCALAGIVREVDVKRQRRYYQLSGIILMGSSILYIIYSIRLILHPVVSVYSSYMAINIAAFTFTELTLNIRGVIIERKNHTLLIHAIKMINLASSLICLVLTQTAILSFAEESLENQPAANGLFGIIMGSVAAFIGVVMILRVQIIQKKEAKL